MCKFCNIERGTRDTLLEGELELKLGKHTLDFLNVTVDVGCDKKDQLSVGFNVFNDEGAPFIEMDLPIRYCPMCGRELPHTDE